MDLGYGFTKGSNKVSRQKVQYWLHLDYEINWIAFLWYMTQYITIVDYNENGFEVEILSEKQREWFYKKVIEYNDEMGIHNYSIDKTNDLYKDHNAGYDRNKHIIERLVAEEV